MSKSQASILVRARETLGGQGSAKQDSRASGGGGKEASGDSPEYLALVDDEPGVAIRLKITSVKESPFFFVDED